MAAQTPQKTKASPVIDLTFSPAENVEEERVRLYMEVDRERVNIQKCERRIKNRLDKIAEIEGNLLNQSKASEVSSSNKRSLDDDSYSSEGSIISEIVFGNKKREIPTFYNSA
jgi:hypothetical protein